jgi:hypothetical protein
MAAARPLVPQPAAFGATAKAQTKAEAKQEEASDHGNPLHDATIADLMCWGEPRFLGNNIII